MPTFVAINRSNNFDGLNQQQFATQEAAENAAKESIKNFPNQEIYVAQLLVKVSASVRVSSSEVGDPPAQPVEGAESGDQAAS